VSAAGVVPADVASLPPSESVRLPAAVQDGIAARLNDLRSEIRWSASFDDVEQDPATGVAADGGVIVKLGNIRVLGDGSVRVPASLYYAPLGAGGRTYLLEESSHGWSITGTTNSEWIS